MRIQEDRCYQKKRNKKISVLKKETKSLSCILEKMQRELDMLMALVDAQQTLEREEQKCNKCDDEKEGLLHLSKVVGDDF